MELFYTEPVRDPLRAYRGSNASEQPRKRTPADSANLVASHCLAEVCDDAVKEATDIFRSITGEKELFEATQGGDDDGDEE